MTSPIRYEFIRDAFVDVAVPAEHAADNYDWGPGDIWLPGFCTPAQTVRAGFCSKAVVHDRGGVCKRLPRSASVDPLAGSGCLRETLEHWLVGHTHQGLIENIRNLLEKLGLCANSYEPRGLQGASPCDISNAFGPSVVDSEVVRKSIGCELGAENQESNFKRMLLLTARLQPTLPAMHRFCTSSESEFGMSRQPAELLNNYSIAPRSGRVVGGGGRRRR